MSEPASQTGLLRAYRGATRALGPLLPLWMERRARAGKEDLARLNERKGIASLPRPDGPLVWMHGASVGECTMLLPLISQFRKDRPDINILITSATVTAAHLLEVRLPDGCFHQYVPLDHPKYVSAFLDYWTPDTALWAESEIWPNMITEAKSRGVKMALINARMSENSLKGWTKREASAKAVFSKFDLILAADKRTGDSLGWFTGRDISATGNLKDAGETLPANAEDLRRLQQSLAGRPIWCAASTHMGEDELILRAHEDILSVHPNALLILAPRHPERRDDILNLINSYKFMSATRSEGKVPNKKTQVYLFDTIGEMGLAFRLAALTFVCGSLVKGLTGHNPLEPARLGSAVLTGGNTASFSETYNAMFSFGAARRVLSPEIVGKEVSALFSDQDALENLQKKARRYAESRDDVLTYVWDELQPLLPKVSAS